MSKQPFTRFVRVCNVSKKSLVDITVVRLLNSVVNLRIQETLLEKIQISLKN